MYSSYCILTCQHKLQYIISLYRQHCYDRYPQVDCLVYTGDVEADDEEILTKARDRLGVEPIREVEFIYLHTRHWVEARRYPMFTLLGQSLGSLVLGKSESRYLGYSVEVLWVIQGEMKLYDVYVCMYVTRERSV